MVQKYRWEIDRTAPGQSLIRIFSVADTDRIMSWGDVINGLQTAEFAELFSDCLCKCGSDAYFWETPALTRQGLDRPFECVTISAPALVTSPADATSSRSQFEKARADRQAVAFPNLRGDSMLVAPCPTGENTRYAHLGAFLRSAAVGQLHDFWALLAQTVEARLAEREKLWVSTSGLGVSWLHARIDDRPKYYSYAPYRSG